MNSVKAICTATLLVLVLSVPTFAGEIGSPGSPRPCGEIGSPGITTTEPGTSSTDPGDLETPGFMDFVLTLITLF